MSGPVACALWALLSALWLMFIIALDLVRDADMMATVADIDRIEASFNAVDDDPACSVPCTARHCADHSGVTGTIAQRRHSRADEQAVAAVEHGASVGVPDWNVPTGPLPILDALDAIGVTCEVPARARDRFEHDGANPFAVHISGFWLPRGGAVDKLSGLWAEPAPDVAELFDRQGAELLAIGGRR